MNERVAGLRPRRSGNCPLCGKPVADRYRPFCSSRCADVDLNRWLSGAYVIPGQPEDDTEPPVPPPESD